MSPLLIKAETGSKPGCLARAPIGETGLTYVGFEARSLAENEEFALETKELEYCLVLLSGRADVTVDGREFRGIGTRASVFDDISPDAVYIPHGSRFTVTARGGPAELGICAAPGGGDHAARLIRGDTIRREDRGTGHNTRFVRNILPETEPAHSLLVVEVRTPAGNWSSYPPHKHDTLDLPHETQLEETYYHRVHPPCGFAFQRVYTDDRSLDETMAIEDGDVVLVPRGYHPVAAAHGYELYYLNVMAGQKRLWRFRNDPAHDWLMNG